MWVRIPSGVQKTVNILCGLICFTDICLMKKKCPKCNTEKPFELFRPNKYRKDGRQVYCKICDDEMQHKWYLKNKEKVKANAVKRNKEQKLKNIEFVLLLLKSKCCEDCGESNPIVLEFHHLSDKLYNVSTLIGNSWSHNKIKTEIEKCKVLCSNCHKIETSKQQGWYKLLLINGLAATAVE